MNNLLRIPDRLKPASGSDAASGFSTEQEYSEAIIPDRGILIERIISTGQASPEGFWYDQERDEWVVLIQGRAKLTWESGKVLEMQAGDWVFIPAHERHRVDWTSQEPPCIWLAVHGKLQ